MFKSHDIKLTREDRLINYFNIAASILTIYPIISYFYISTILNQNGVSLIEAFDTNPVLTLNMISVFLLVYCAYLVFNFRKNLRDGLSGQLITLNLIILLMSQTLVKNMVGIGVFSVLIYFTISSEKVKFSELISTLKTQKNWSKLIGSIFVLLINTVLILLTLRIKAVLMTM